MTVMNLPCHIWYWICSFCGNNKPFPFTNVTNRIRLLTGIVITWATRRVLHVEKDLLTLPKDRISTKFMVGFVSLSLEFPMSCLVYYYVSVCQFVFFFFNHVVVSLFFYLWVWLPLWYLSPLFYWFYPLFLYFT